MNKALHALHDVMRHATAIAYRVPWLIANPVLARSPNTDLIAKHLDHASDRAGWRQIFKTLPLYYWNNGKNLLRLFKQAYLFKTTTPKGGQPIELRPICIDTVLYLDDAIRRGTIETCNLPGLEEALRKEGVPYTICADLYGELDEDKMRTLQDLMGSANTSVLCNLHFFTLASAVKLCFFYLGYPWLLFLFVLTWANQNETTTLVKDECLATLGQDVITAYKRYLYGAALGRKCVQDTTMLSWHENRAGDKFFYRGLRQTDCHMEIVGMQPYLFPANYLGGVLNKTEVDKGLAPDRIVVNGSHYLSTQSVLPVRIGHSLRYRHIFERPPIEDRGDNILILLPYLERSAHKVIDLANTILDNEFRAIVRLHPTFSQDTWSSQLPDHWEISTRPLSEDLARAKYAIGSETGSLVEAVASGIPGIHVNTMGQHTLAYMPLFGKGKVWHEVANEDELRQAISQASDCSYKQRTKYAMLFRETLFCNPLEGDLLQSIGLSSRRR